MDFAAVTRWLSEAYWSPGITEAEVAYGAANSTFVAGGFTTAGEQVSYLRVVSDRARFAYLLDVIVDPGHRRRGIGKDMLRFAMGHPDLQLVYQWLLRTRDAQDVYASLGFARIDGSDHWMIVQKPRPDRPHFAPPPFPAER